MRKQEGQNLTRKTPKTGITRRTERLIAACAITGIELLIPQPYTAMAAQKCPSTTVQWNPWHTFTLAAQYALTLNTRWNLIGYSSDTAVNVDDLVFTNSTGTQTTWANTWAQGKMAAYFSYYDSWQAVAGNRKFKYAAPTAFSMDEDTLNNYKGYWAQAAQAGNLTMPSSGGSLSAATYDIRNLMFKNGTGTVLNITNAANVTNNWTDDKLYYYNPPDFSFKIAATSGGHTSTIKPWVGYFIKANEDNITLLRRDA